MGLGGGERGGNADVDLLRHWGEALRGAAVRTLCVKKELYDSVGCILSPTVPYPLP